MGSGNLSVEVFTGNKDLPVKGATIVITNQSGVVLYTLTSNENGLTDYVELETPPGELCLDPDYEGDVYSKYNVKVTAQGYRTTTINGAQMFDKVSSSLPVNMLPLMRNGTGAPVNIEIGENALRDPSPRDQDGGTPDPRILREVIIPDFITVHLGLPNSPAQNVRVPFIDYLKNVASSEIYPDWPKASLEANILCQITFALNRIYTEKRPLR